MATVKSNSFLTFVYPITLESGNFDKIVEAVDTVEISDGGFKIWKPDEFPHEELLPHVADYLNPRNNQPPTARLWEMTNDALASPKGLGGKADWRLVMGKDREMPFKFDCINLFMFRVGIGFLAFRVIPKSNDLSDWLDLLHYFRFTKRDHYLTARLKTGKDTYDSFFPPIAVPASEEQKTTGEQADGKTETVASQTSEKKGTLSQIINGLLGIIDDKADLAENWWDEIFIHNQMLGYAAVLVDDFPAAEDFDLLYRMRNFFPGGKEIYPSQFDLSPNHPSLLEYGNRQWFTFSLDGGSFLACDPADNEFFSTTLPEHIRKAYFHVFIIALHQRFALMSMSHEVAEKWLIKGKDEKGYEEEKIEAFNRIRDRFLSFTARGYFAQVMQREHHHRCYRKWQETFELQRMYDEVREEVREMFEWLQLNHAKEQAVLIKQETDEAARREKEAKQRAEKLAKEEARREKETKERVSGFERRLTLFGLLITLGIGIPALVTGFFGMNITEPDFKFGLLTAVVWFFGAVITSVSIALGIFIYINRRQETSENKTQEDEDKTPEDKDKM